jgi:hypothetical protein
MSHASAARRQGAGTPPGGTTADTNNGFRPPRELAPGRFKTAHERLNQTIALDCTGDTAARRQPICSPPDLPASPGALRPTVSSCTISEQDNYSLATPLCKANTAVNQTVHSL